MKPPKLFFTPRSGAKARAAVFLSGSGSNAERILEKWAAEGRDLFDIAALVTDRPERSRAREIGAAFNVPVVEHDIFAFYRRRGLRRVSLGTDEARQARAAWTDELRAQLAPLEIDLGLFAGFIPLSNITADFPCLNVHPGDLTYLKDGQRLLIGLHTVPIEIAILEGLNYLRSSVILADSYHGGGDDMDSGVILGISAKVSIDLHGYSLDELGEIAARRPERRPPKGYQDELEELAGQNQELLKEGGDWVVFPRVAFDFAAGKFALGDSGQLLYREGNDWQPVRTVVYGPEQREILPA